MTITDETPCRASFTSRWRRAAVRFSGALLDQHHRDRIRARLPLLYGGQLKYRTEASTGNGDPYFSVDGFIAQRAIPHRDEFRGTGNSVYFLSFQDLVVGGEKLTVEVRDPSTVASRAGS